MPQIVVRHTAPVQREPVTQSASAEQKSPSGTAVHWPAEQRMLPQHCARTVHAAPRSRQQVCESDDPRHASAPAQHCESASHSPARAVHDGAARHKPASHESPSPHAGLAAQHG